MSTLHGKRKPFLHRLHDYFFPHKRNNYRPHFFGATSLTVFVIGIVVLEGAYLAQIKLVFPNTSFLASVLPGTLVALTNQDRTANDVPAVTENATLDRAATLAAQDMASKGYFAHVSPSGVTPWDWLDQVGYQYTYAGENLAVNFTDSTAVENAWMASPEHHANIVKPQYTQVGIGVANGMYQGQQTTFVVTFFATPANPPASSQVAVSNLSTAPPPSLPTTTLPTPSQDTVPTTSSVRAAHVTPPPSASVPAVITVPTKESFLPSFLSSIATAPTNTIVLVLSLLAGIVLILFIIAITVKWRVQYIEVIGGGLVLLGLLIGLIMFNAHNVSSVQVSTGSQSAAVEAGL